MSDVGTGSDVSDGGRVGWDVSDVSGRRVGFGRIGRRTSGRVGRRVLGTHRTIAVPLLVVHPRGMFPWEKLEVYQVSVEFETLVNELVKIIAPRAENLAIEIETATDSLICNICEGSSRYFPAEKAQFYRYARGSVNEAIAGIRRAFRKKLISEEDAKEAEALASRISVMLYRLIKKMEELDTKARKSPYKNMPKPTKNPPRPRPRKRRDPDNDRHDIS